MTRKEWELELDSLVAACRSFQHAIALEDDDDRTHKLEEVWNLTEDIINVREHMRGGKW